jgi:hypothetical protein
MGLDCIVQKGQKYDGARWVVIGIFAGGIFILCYQMCVEKYGGVTMLRNKKGIYQKDGSSDLNNDYSFIW